MGEDKSNSDNEKRQNNKTIQQEIFYQQIQKQIIDDMNKQSGSLNSGDSTSQSDSSVTSDTSNNSCIKLLSDKAVNINVLRFELDRLQLDFKARAYFENDVKPLIDTLYSLSLASIDFSATATNMSNTSFGRSSKIKDALELAEGINEVSEDLIKVLRCKVDNMLKFSKYDCK